MYKDGMVAPSPDAEEEQNRKLNNACVFVYKTCMFRSFINFFFQNEITYLQKIFNIHIINKSEDKS